jgi:hypothetical protein
LRRNALRRLWRQRRLSAISAEPLFVVLGA